MISPKSKTAVNSGEEGATLLKCLTECDLNDEVTVLKINSGKNAKRSLENLGLNRGAVLVKKKVAPKKGPVERKVKGSCLVLGRGLAEKVIVKCDCTCPIRD